MDKIFDGANFFENQISVYTDILNKGMEWEGWPRRNEKPIFYNFLNNINTDGQYGERGLIKIYAPQFIESEFIDYHFPYMVEGSTSSDIKKNPNKNRKYTSYTEGNLSQFSEDQIKLLEKHIENINRLFENSIFKNPSNNNPFIKFEFTTDVKEAEIVLTPLNSNLNGEVNSEIGTADAVSFQIAKAFSRGRGYPLDMLIRNKNENGDYYNTPLEENFIQLFSSMLGLKADMSKDISTNSNRYIAEAPNYYSSVMGEEHTKISNNGNYNDFTFLDKMRFEYSMFLLEQESLDKGKKFGVINPKSFATAYAIYNQTDKKYITDHKDFFNKIYRKVINIAGAENVYQDHFKDYYHDATTSPVDLLLSFTTEGTRAFNDINSNNPVIKSSAEERYNDLFKNHSAELIKNIDVLNKHIANDFLIDKQTPLLDVYFKLAENNPESFAEQLFNSEKEKVYNSKGEVKSESDEILGLKFIEKIPENILSELYIKLAKYAPNKMLEMLSNKDFDSYSLRNDESLAIVYVELAKNAPEEFIEKISERNSTFLGKIPKQARGEILKTLASNAPSKFIEKLNENSEFISNIKDFAVAGKSGALGRLWDKYIEDKEAVKPDSKNPLASDTLNKGAFLPEILGILAEKSPSKLLEALSSNGDLFKSVKSEKYFVTNKALEHLFNILAENAPNDFINELNKYNTELVDRIPSGAVVEVLVKLSQKSSELFKQKLEDTKNNELYNNIPTNYLVSFLNHKENEIEFTPNFYFNVINNASNGKNQKFDIISALKIDPEKWLPVFKSLSFNDQLLYTNFSNLIRAIHPDTPIEIDKDRLKDSNTTKKSINQNRMDYLTNILKIAGNNLDTYRRIFQTILDDADNCYFCGNKEDTKKFIEEIKIKLGINSEDPKEKNKNPSPYDIKLEDSNGYNDEFIKNPFDIDQSTIQAFAEVTISDSNSNSQSPKNKKSNILLS